MGSRKLKSDLPGNTSSDIGVLQEKGFILDTLVGEGSYAKVYKSTHMVDETTHVVLACKVIDTSLAPREYLTKFLPRELDVLIRVNHPHIVNVCNIFQRRAKYYIFLRFAENGDLLEFLLRYGAISENQSRFWMRQIISALEYIHALDIAHRDLKCENILITANYNVKLTDFGFTRVVRYGDKEVLSETFCGSLSYAAPEVLKGVPYAPKKADIWSIGIILYTMLNKSLPFNENSAKRLYEKQVTKKWRFRSNVVNTLSTECKQQVTSLLEPNPEDRPTASGVFNGSWILMDTRLAKLSHQEDTLLKQATSKAGRKGDDMTEDERMAEFRRKARMKDGLIVLKNIDLSALPRSKQLFEEDV